MLYMGGETMADSNNGMEELLAKLHPQTPVSEIIVDGTCKTVTKFISFDEDSNLAYFSTTGGGTAVADSTKISLIEFV
jgi:hypothetical protein